MSKVTTVNKITARTEKEKLWEVAIIFTAADRGEAERLWDAMMDAIGCNDDEDHVCPHHRCSVLRTYGDHDANQ